MTTKASVSIVPNLSVHDGPAAIAWYQQAFGAVVTFQVGHGDEVFAALTIGDAPFFVASEAPAFGNLSPKTLGGPGVRIDLLLPTQTTFLRGMIERACAKAGFPPRVVAEIESVPVLTGALTAGLGATVLPRTIAEALRRDAPPEIPLGIRRIVSPALRAPLSLCQLETPPESPAIAAVQDILLGCVRDFLATSLKRVPA